MINLSDVLKVANDAADAAGEIIKQNFKSDLTIYTKSSARDYVTQVDHMSQEAIIDVIQKTYPEHRFIAEEEGADDLGDPDSPYVWIIDPIDGTTNFIHGKTECGTMVALMEESAGAVRKPRMQIGVMLVPMRNTRYHVVRGGGAFMTAEDDRNLPLRVRKTNGMNDAILCTNTMKNPDAEKEGALQIKAPFCAAMHNYGCALTELAAIAAGENDGLFFHGPGLWDIAAGCLLIEEAGGKYKYELLEEGNVRAGIRCVASTPDIFEELCEWVF